ncbi:CRISPR-associated protein Cas4 [Acrocarpospora catenulata]|uniref:CRISPR-associated protein Cas4 n=1 Tax=Acrocarpospora catenulata TaxID=2836182 RepID=UPI001BD9EB22|nr:CRISPR-associated protein Cas4 [Acrocarpospora catenulata]
MGLNPPQEQGDADPVSIPLSALEHVAYCRRQAALIHVEATWADNADTARGDLVHQAVDLPGTRSRRGLTLIRALPVASRAFGLHGVCDLVEITAGTATPVEYKVGAYRPSGAADLQVAGQALCLREAGFHVPAGYVYSAAERRRHEVVIDDALIDAVRDAAEQMRRLLAAERLPPAHNDRRCRRCSLRDDCIPEITGTQPQPRDLFTPRPLGAWHDN